MGIMNAPMMLAASSGDDVDFMVHGLIPLKFFGHKVWITTTHVTTLIVMVFIIVLALIARHAVLHGDEKPSGLQNFVEMVVEMLDNLVKGNMGRHWRPFVNYIGNYDYYLEKKEELTAKYAPVSPETSVNSKVTNPNTFSESQEPFGQKLSWQEQKEAQARERKRKNDLKKTEERIAVLETRNQEIDELMTQEDIYSNSVKCQELAIEKSSNEEELETLYEQWADLAEE